MRLILISAEVEPADEQALIFRFYQAGLRRFHLRRPAWGLAQCQAWLASLPAEMAPIVTLHQSRELALAGLVGGVHLKEKEQNEKGWNGVKKLKQVRPDLRVSLALHGLENWPEESKGADYGLLSPVFSSLSKSGYQADWSLSQIKRAVELSSLPLYALGGVEAENIAKLKAMGFAGCAVLGAVWQQADPVAAFLKIKQVVEQTWN